MDMQHLKLPELMDVNTYIDIERMSKYAAAAAKKAMTKEVAWEVKRQLPNKKLDKIQQIAFIWKHPNRRRDMDNVEFAQKFIWDGMVLAGLIPSDGWRHRPTETTHNHVVNKDNSGVMVIFK